MSVVTVGNKGHEGYEKYGRETIGLRVMGNTGTEGVREV